MAGTVPNSNITDAIDQLIVAINDIDVTVETAELTAKLEELRLLYETESLAGIVAQNTNFSDLITAIESLVLSCDNVVQTTILNQTINCGSSGTHGAGTWPAPASPNTGVFGDPGADPIPGFEDKELSDQYQCDMAHKIITEMITDISVAGLLAAGGAAGAALIAVLIEFTLTPIGWVAWIGVAGAVVYCVYQGIEISELSQLIYDNKEEFICELLAGSDVAGSISNFAALVDSKVDGDSLLGILPEIGRSKVKELIISYASVDSINRLYTKSAVPPPGGNDCSDCGPQTIAYTVSYGNEITENPATPIQIEMVYESGYGCGSAARHGGISFSGPVTITYFNVSGTGVGQCGGGHICYYYSDAGGVTLITSKPANNVEEVTGVQSIYSFCAVSSGNPTLEIGYLPE